MNNQTTTRFLVLRKTAYSETSLIVAGLAPELGQLHFMVRGERRISKRQSPLVDLFRVLEVSFIEKPDGLQTWRQAELVDDFTALAQNYQAFSAAARIAKFALANCLENNPQPITFAAITAALQKLCELRNAGDPGDATVDNDKCIDSILARVAQEYLHENGLLPKPTTAQMDDLHQLQKFLTAADCRRI